MKVPSGKNLAVWVGWPCYLESLDQPAELMGQPLQSIDVVGGLGERAHGAVFSGETGIVEVVFKDGKGGDRTDRRRAGQERRMSEHTRTGNVTASPSAEPTAAPDLSAQLDAVRIAVGKVDALAAVTLLAYDDTSWCLSESLHAERIAYLIGAVADAAAAAVMTVSHVQAAVSDEAPATHGEEEW